MLDNAAQLNEWNVIREHRISGKYRLEKKLSLGKMSKRRRVKQTIFMKRGTCGCSRVTQDSAQWYMPS